MLERLRFFSSSNLFDVWSLIQQNVRAKLWSGLGDIFYKTLKRKSLSFTKPLEIISPVKLIPTSPLSTNSTSPLFNNCNRYLSIPFFLPKSCFLSPSLSWIYFSSSFYQSEVVFPPPPYSFKTTGCKTQCRPLSTIRNKTDAQK